MADNARLFIKGSQAKNESRVAPKQRTGFSRPPASPINQVLFLQRTLGNQAVQRLFTTGTIQPKLRIGQPNDIYEKEADRVADEVMRMPEPIIQPKPTLPFANDSSCQEEEPIQAKTAEDVTPEVTPDISSTIQSLQGGGRPLFESERSFFEPRFGADFSSVRVHNDTRAASLSRSVNARAFTLGHNVVFGAGEYSPDTSAGRKLLAHELTHVVQQGDGLRRKMTLGEPGDEYGQEADEVARNVIQQEQYTSPNPSTHEQVGGEIEDEEDLVQKKYSTAPPGPSRTSPTIRSTTHAPAVRSVHQAESHHSSALGENALGLPVDEGMEQEEELLVPSIALESLPQMPDTPSRSKYSVRRSPAMLGGVADTEKPRGQSVIPRASKQRSLVRHAITPNRIQRADLIFNVIESGLSTVAESDEQDDPEVVSARRVMDVTEQAPGSRLEANSLNEMIDDLQNRVGQTDCLRDLVIWNHGGPRGQLVFRPHSGAAEFSQEAESPSRFTTEWIANSENRDRINTLRQLFCCNRGRMSWMGCAVAGVRALGGTERASSELEQCIASGEGTEAECRERYQEHWNIYQNLPQAEQYQPDPSTLQYGVANMQYWANATCAMVTGANDLTTFVPGAPIPYRVRHGGRMMAVLPTEPCPCEGNRVGTKSSGIGAVPEYLEGYLERECGFWEYGLIRPALERAQDLVGRAVQSLRALMQHQAGFLTRDQVRAQTALESAFNIWDPRLWPDEQTSSAAPSPSAQLAQIRQQNRQRTQQILDRFTTIQSTLAASIGALSSEPTSTPEGTPTITCRAAQNPHCTGGQTFASARREGQALAFCPAFFENRRPSSMAASNITGDDRRALILIHEYSHLAGTTDRGPTYLWYGCPPSMGKLCLLPGDITSTECTTPPDFTDIADAYRCFVQVQSFASSSPTEPESSESG